MGDAQEPQQQAAAGLPGANLDMDFLVEQAIQAAEARANMDPLMVSPSAPTEMRSAEQASGLPQRVSPSGASVASSPSHKIRSQGSPASVGSGFSPANSTVFSRSPYNSRMSPYQQHLSPGADNDQGYAYHNRFYQPAYQYPPMQDPAFLYTQYPTARGPTSPYINYGYIPSHPGSPNLFYPAQLPNAGAMYNSNRPYLLQSNESMLSHDPQQPSHVSEEAMHLQQAENDGFQAGYATALLHSSLRGSQQAIATDKPVSPAVAENLANFQAQSSTPSGELLPYSPLSPPNLERGHLAQANLHNAVYGRPAPLAHQYPEQQHRRKQSGPNSALPKPPAHSDFALWIGNVPADSSHNELWRFFNSRPSPASAGLQHSPEVQSPEAPDLGWTGVQSIHLIARSNCCFVNYASQVHLDHAIKVSHGVSLRPFDPRVKPLVCRVRKKEDDSRTGVGAQRGRGLHHQWAYEQAKAAKEQKHGLGGDVLHQSQGEVHEHDYAFDKTPRADEHSAVQQQLSHNSSASTDISNASTSSSFLSRHFAKRYFILKSHTEEDLELSLKQSVWATQSHNEPVLDQAYRTSREGVFLIFSANKSGEFYGFAKMNGPITPEPANSKSTKGSDSSLQAQPAQPGIKPNPKLSALFGGELAASPSPLTPGQTSPEKEAYQAAALRSLVSVAQQRSAPVSSPPHQDSDSEDTLAARRGLSLDVDALAKAEGGIRDLSLSTNTAQETGKVVQATEAAGNDALVKAAMTHNAKLDDIPDETESKVPAGGDRHSSSSVDRAWGRPFKIQWIKAQRLPFNRARHVRNAFNRNREVKISRDGTELDPMAGEMLLSLFFNQAPPSESPYQEHFPSSQMIASR